MKEIKLYIGSSRIMQNGQQDDDTRPVMFTGELVYARTAYIGTDTRSVTESLYRTDDGRQIVYVEDRSRWQGETTTRSLHEIDDDDLQPGGQFEALGLAAGIGRPLTLDEALEREEAKNAEIS